MERLTVRIPKKHYEELTDLVEDDEYPNRSEAVREAVRDFLDDLDQDDGGRRRWPFGGNQ